MFNSGSAATSGNTSLFGTSTPVNQNRTSTGLFGNTTTQPNTLTSTPFGSTSLFGGASPANTTLQHGSTGTGTIHKYDSVAGTDKVTKNGAQTQIRVKHCNICVMPVYEKKSMEELRFEDYMENRKFSTTATSTAGGLFPSVSSGAPLFGGSSPAVTSTTNSTNIFGTNTAPSTLNSTFFGNNKPAVTTTSTLPFAFGAPTTTTAAAAAPFSFGGPTTTTANPNAPFGTTAASTTSASPFAFGAAQAPAATATPAFSFGGSTSLFPTATTTTAGSSFGFSVSKPTTTGTFSFTPSTAASTASPFSLFPTTTTTTTAPTLFSTQNQTITAQPVLSTQSSVDTRTHLQLFQTMLNIQPFNSELGFLARNIKPNIGLDRTRIRTVPDSNNTHPLTNVFTSLIPKPSVLTSNTSTPPPTLVTQLPTHCHTLPSVLLPSTTTNTSITLLGKRKLADSFLDDDDDNSLMMDDGPSLSINKITKTNVLKRPRILDMNKVRSVVLGGGGGGIINNEIQTKEEIFSDTFTVKPTSDNLSGWKKFATYDAYLASKQQQQQQQQPIEPIKASVDEDDKQKNLNEQKFEQERAFRLPKLAHDDYYTKPTIDELRNYFNPKGQCIVKEFTVGREHYGSVTFQGSKINLAGLDLNQLIEIGRRQVTVYPDDKNKPAVGEELNCQAIISLLGVYPIDRSISNSGEEVTDPDRLIEMNYGHYLRGMTKKFNGKFVDFDVYTGTWTFKVDHF
ncbi:unnamed protein product [Rotaria socialis]|uniref:Nuclear pore complex protein Nup98-Nup96 n=1 Tax=Rotaria socialis TaxID=392032 RepID=A0A817UBI2_9BILA|nr:unnamed protein product [Rotaria socialis]